TCSVARGGDRAAAAGDRRQRHPSAGLRALPRRARPRANRIAAASVGFDAMRATLAAGVCLLAVAGAATASAPQLGTAGLKPPGPGKPIFVVDTGLDFHHPVFDGRPNTFALNPQKVSSPDDFHGTAISSLMAAIYPRVRLYEWDASERDGLVLSSIIAGI